MYLKIKNDGLIEEGALTLIGASDKRENDKIGQFGSGNKYAIALLMRENYDVRIFSGLEPVELSVKKQQFRGTEFGVIYVNGKQTSITTDMGVMDWSLWQAIREIYSNAIDEGGQSISQVKEIEPKKDETHFYIKVSRELKELLGNIDKYFALGDKRVVAKTEYGRILRKHGTNVNIYRRGIRCYNAQNNSAFDYDFNNVRINESRVIPHTFMLAEGLWKMVFSLDDKEIIMPILKKSIEPDAIEGSMQLVTLPECWVSSGFKEAIRDVKLGVKEYAGLVPPDKMHEYTFVPKQVYRAITGKSENDLINFHDDVGAWRKIDKTEYHQKVINDALHFLKECDWRKIEYPINVAIFEQSDIMGMAHNSQIYLSEDAIDRGVDTVVKTLIEEYIHIRHAASDSTRKMQDAIINEFVTYMKKKNAYII